MMRFIDLGKQIGLTEEWPREFAFFDTITDAFVEIAGEQTWESWNDFFCSCLIEKRDVDIERFKGLCHSWVFEDSAARTT